MCGRYMNVDTELRDVAIPPDVQGILVPRYNISPNQLAPIVALDAEGRRAARAHHWGLAPAWAAPKMQRPINARAEGVRTNGMFRGAFAKRRCLVPAGGFYEWQKSGTRRCRSSSA